MLPFALCLVWVWFEQREDRRNRLAVGQAIVGAFFAILAARLIQNLSAYSPRPLHAEGLDYNLPHGVAPDVLHDWSSFPSDTAALAFALVVGIWLASRPLGWLAFLWAVVVVSIPRIYAGLHYPSDIVGGAILGSACTLACSLAFPWTWRRRLSPRWRERLAPLWSRRESILYAFAFLVLFQITIMFNDIRLFAEYMLDVYKGL